MMDPPNKLIKNEGNAPIANHTATKSTVSASNTTAKINIDNQNQIKISLVIMRLL
jgi:hypothetical protein